MFWCEAKSERGGSDSKLGFFLGSSRHTTFQVSDLDVFSYQGRAAGFFADLFFRENWSWHVDSAFLPAYIVVSHSLQIMHFISSYFYGYLRANILSAYTHTNYTT